MARPQIDVGRPPFFLHVRLSNSQSSEHTSQHPKVIALRDVKRRPAVTGFAHNEYVARDAVLLLSKVGCSINPPNLHSTCENFLQGLSLLVKGYFLQCRWLHIVCVPLYDDHLPLKHTVALKGCCRRRRFRKCNVCRHRHRCFRDWAANLRTPVLMP